MNHFSVHLVQNDVLTYRQQFVCDQKQESKTFALLIRSVGFLGNAYSQKSKENNLDLAFLALILKKQTNSYYLQIQMSWIKKKRKKRNIIFSLAFSMMNGT